MDTPMTMGCRVVTPNSASRAALDHPADRGQFPHPSTGPISLRRTAVWCLLFGWLGIPLSAMGAPPVIWDGGGTDNYWSTAENWTGDQEPTVFDDVVFNGTSSRNCVIVANVQIVSFTVASGYSGSISRSGGNVVIMGNVLIQAGSTDFGDAVVSVEGTTTIASGSINWGGNWTPGYWRGDVLQTGGSATWGTSWAANRDFYGSFTRTGGTVVNTSAFHFKGAGAHTLATGPGGMSFGRFNFEKPSGASLNVTGDINLVTTNTLNVSSGGTMTLNGSVSGIGNFSLSSSGTTMSLSGSMTLISNSSLSISDGSTLNVQNGSVVDAMLTSSYSNSGIVTETGSGKILHRASGLGFTDVAGTPISAVPVGSGVYITLIDEDENVNGAMLDATQVTVRSVNTGDTETLTLTETGVVSEQFRNTISLLTAAGPANPGDGILQQDGVENLQVAYSDDEDISDTVTAYLRRPPVVWDGGGIDFNWTTANNWSTDQVPTVFDSVLFNGTSSKNCVIIQNVQVIDFTVAAGYGGGISRTGGNVVFTGNTSIGAGTTDFGDAVVSVDGTSTITAGSINWGSNWTPGIWRGNISHSGGSVTWGTSWAANRDIYASLIRTGGAVVNSSACHFKGAGHHTLATGPGGMSFGRFNFEKPGGSSLTVSGDVSLVTTNTFNANSGGTLNLNGNVTGVGTFSHSSSGTTTNVAGRVTMNPNSSFQVDGGTTLNLVNGGVFDALQATSFLNNGIMTETGTGKILRRATDLAFIDVAGNPVAVIPAGTPVYITIVDEDENIDGTVADTTQVVLSSMTTGDSETLSLTENGIVSELFRNTMGMPTVAGAATPGDGILQQNGTENLRVVYTDDEDLSDTLTAFLQRPTVVWDGGGADNNWITAANWSTDQVPTVFDNVLFNGTSSRNCVITQNVDIIDFTVASGYAGSISRTSGSVTIRGNAAIGSGSTDFGDAVVGVEGTTTISGGAINWGSNWTPGYWRGDVLQSGGTVTWGTSWAANRDFYGNFTRTGGTVINSSACHFKGPGMHTLITGPGGMSFGRFNCEKPAGSTLTVNGDINLVTTNTFNVNSGGTMHLNGNVNGVGSFSLSSSGTNLNVNGTIGLISNSSFSVDGGATLNVLDGSLIDAFLALTFSNAGLMNEIGTGRIHRLCIGVGFTTPAGVIVPNIPAGTDIFITMFDGDENIDGDRLDVSSVTLTNLTTGDLETFELTETEVRSGRFLNMQGFPSICGFARPGNGVFEGQDGDTLEIRYVDGEDATDELHYFNVFVGGCTDCNSNGIDDADDIAGATSDDCNTNDLPDECDIASGAAHDTNGNGQIDECETTCEPAAIMTQPNSLTVCAGPPVTLSIVGQGTPPLAYQWRRGGVGISGATSANYVLDDAEPQDSGTYDAIVQNTCGSVVSDAATLLIWATGGSDTNGDGRLDGNDIGAFMDVLLHGSGGEAGLAFCAADVNGDGAVTYADVPGFVAVLTSP